MRTRSLLLALACLAGWSAVPQAAGQSVPPIFWDAKERLPKPDVSTLERLRFLTTTDFPPFNYIDGGGRLSGFHIDLSRAICNELAIAEKCQIQALPWGELQSALAGGQGEAILAGLAITPDSRERFSFSRPYLHFPARFVVPKTNAAAEPIYETLQGRRIGVVAGSAHEAMLRDYFPGVEVVPYPAEAGLYADLKAGKNAGAFGDGMRLAFWLAGSDAGGCCRFVGGPYLAPEYLGHGLAIALRPEDALLTDALDYALQQIAVKGTFAELYLRYFPLGFF